MLSCIIGSKSINSFDYDEAKLREWSNKEILKCPECNERVIYCKGDYKIPYFKHEIGSECSGNKYYEPMTEEHINGIKMLYNRLKEIKGVGNLEVEKYIKNTKQRPDIYFEYEGERYCIEYQCSPISTQYNKRHELYQLEGINDIWILGFDNFHIEEIDALINKEKRLLESKKDRVLTYMIQEKIDKYINMKNNKKVTFERKRVKSIEDEINYSESPLIYYNPKAGYLYKATDVATISDRNKIMTQTSKMVLKMIEIKEVQLKDILLKTNSPLNTDANKLKYVLKYRNNDIKILSKKYRGFDITYYMWRGTIEKIRCEYSKYYGFNKDIDISFKDNNLKDILSTIDDFIYNANKLYDKNKQVIEDIINIKEYYKDILKIITRYNCKIKKIKDKKVYIKSELCIPTKSIELLEGGNLFDNIKIYSNYIEFKGNKYNISKSTMEDTLTTIISDEIRRIRYGQV